MTPVPDAAAWVRSGQQLSLGRGHSIFVRRAGHGPAVLMLHGFPTWSWDWSPVAPHLEPSATVITPDLLGFGHSSKPRQRYSIAEQAELVTGIVDRLGLGAVHLVAHDYGTIVAQELLDRRRRAVLPFAISAVTFLNAAIIADQHRATAAQTLLRRPVIGALAALAMPPSRWRQGLQAVAGPDHRIDDAEFAGLWSGMSYRSSRLQPRRMLHYIDERATESPRWEAALAAFDGPLRLVWGMADPVSGAHVLARARDRYPRATVIELPRVGHWPQFEAPAAVASAILANQP